METIYIVVVVLTSISGLSCLWMLWSLVKLRKRLSQRLLWRQLLALVATDFIWSCFGIPIYLPWFRVTEVNCSIFLAIHQTLEFTSCVLEAQIALGFTVACFHSTCGMRAFNWMLALSLPLGTGIMLLIRRSTHVQLTPDHQCDVSSNDGWDIVVISFCGGIVVTYALGMARAMTSPEVVYHKALRRTVAYLFCFLASYGAKAAQDLLFPGFNAVSHITWFLLCLNGALHTGCYCLQNRRLIMPHRGGKRQLRDQLSFHVDFVESEAGGESGQRPDTQHGADSYFDFDGHVESLVLDSTASSSTNTVSTEEEGAKV